MADPVVITRHGTTTPTTADLANFQLGYDSAADMLYIRDGAGIVFLGGGTNLLSLAGLTYASGSFVKMTGAGTFTLDTNTYYKSGDAPTFGNVTIGAGAAGVDYTLTFNGETSDLVLTWMEDEGYLNIGNDLLMEANEKHYFRDTALGIYSQADGYLDLFADTAVRIGNSSAGAPTTYASFTPAGNVVATGAGRFDGGVGVGADPTSTFLGYFKSDQNGSTDVCIANAANGAASRSCILIGPAGAAFRMMACRPAYATVRYQNKAVFVADSGLSGGLLYVMPSGGEFKIELGDDVGATKFRIKNRNTVDQFTVDSYGNVVANGSVSGKLVPTTAASDPQDATPANRPAGTLYQIIAYSGKLYFCTNAATPTWEMITSA
jgi:hypothetical protein